MFPLNIQASDGRTVVIRPAELNDRTDIIANINAIAAEGIFLQTDRFVLTPDWEASLNDSHNLQKGQLLVLPLNAGRIVGHLRLFPGPYGDKDRHVGSIGLALLREYRGLGIGKALIDCALTWAQLAGFEKLEANIIASNKRAYRLFERFKFEVEGIRQRQIRIQERYEDEVILARPIAALLKAGSK